MSGNRFSSSIVLKQGGSKKSVCQAPPEQSRADRENKKAAGTAHDTVGQPGIQIPAMANTTNMLPKPMYNLLLNEEFSTEYLSTISSTDCSGSMIGRAYI